MSKTVELKKYVFAEKGAKDGAMDGIIALALSVHAQTVTACPVDLGQLANSYMVKTPDKEVGFNTQDGEKAPDSHKISAEPKDNEVIVGTGSDHWYPEFGTRFQVARPHIRPAIAVAKGASGEAVMRKFGRLAMEREYKQRKYERIFG